MGHQGAGIPSRRRDITRLPIVENYRDVFSLLTCYFLGRLPGRSTHSLCHDGRHSTGFSSSPQGRSPWERTMSLPTSFVR
jgi:hypothetical protein